MPLLLLLNQAPGLMSVGTAAIICTAPPVTLVYDVALDVGAAPTIVCTAPPIATLHVGIVVDTATVRYTAPAVDFISGNQALATIGGSNIRDFIRRGSVSITDAINDEPNQCSFIVNAGVTPTVGQDFRMGLGSVLPSSLIFGGTIQTIEQLYDLVLANVARQVTVIDYSYLLNRRRPIKQYASQAANLTVTDLIATYATGFTTTAVVAGLPAVAMSFDGSEDLSACLTRLSNAIGGYWYVDYNKNIHFFLTETAITPDPLDASNTTAQLQPPLNYSVDLSQIRTRVHVEGAGSSASAAAGIGATTIPLNDQTVFSSSGGSVRSGAQVIAYTGKSADAGGGTIVDGVQKSPATPSAASVGTLSVSGITRSGNTATVTTSAAHNYRTGQQVAISGATQIAYNGAFTIAVTGSTTFTVSIPSLPATPATGTIVVIATGHMEPGARDYYVSFISADGESELSAAGNATPTQVANAGVATNITATTGGALANGSYGYAYSFRTPDGETVPVLDGTAWTMTGSNNAFSHTTVPVSSDKRVIARRIWRTTAAGSPAALFLVGDIPDNTTTTFLDIVPDSAFTTAAPTVNTTGGAVVLTSIATGAAGTTARRIYRTSVGDSAKKALVTIGDNSTTAWIDTSADGNLGASAGPSQAGVIGGSTIKTLAGSTSIRVMDLSKFSEAQGWAQVGSQSISFTGRSASSGVGNLTGIQASGIGSIVADITVGSEVTAQPFLKGVTGILYAINQGDAINIRVTRNDTAAQTALAALEGGDGIHEHTIRDSSLVSVTQLNARGDADLALFKTAKISMTYNTLDTKTASGRQIVVNLGPPTNLSTTLTIQRVTITDVNVWEGTPPLYTVTASNTKFTLNDLLRQLGGLLSE